MAAKINSLVTHNIWRQLVAIWETKMRGQRQRSVKRVCVEGRRDIRRKGCERERKRVRETESAVILMLALVLSK